MKQWEKCMYITAHFSVTETMCDSIYSCFQGWSFHWVLPFSLSLSPLTFTKCLDAALALLRLQGIRVSMSAYSKGCSVLQQQLPLCNPQYLSSLNEKRVVKNHFVLMFGHRFNFSWRTHWTKGTSFPFMFGSSDWRGQLSVYFRGHNDHQQWYRPATGVWEWLCVCVWVDPCELS